MGYSIAEHMKSALAVSAIRNAITLRCPAGTVCHSDRGSQGGFNWPSQHLVVTEVLDGSSTAISRSSDPSETSVAGSSEVPASCRGGVLGADRQGRADKIRSMSASEPMTASLPVESANADAAAAR